MRRRGSVSPEKSDLPNRLQVGSLATPLLYEMLRSFTALAATQNLSETVKVLGASRQTIRRHVMELEELVGHTLMIRDERQYQLTQRGRIFAKDAVAVLNKTNDLMAGTMQNEGRLAFVHFFEEESPYFLSRQHSLLSAAQSDLPLIANSLFAWAQAKGKLEHPSMLEMADYFVTYRQQVSEWVYVQVGEKSSLATWLGYVWAKSQIGDMLSTDILSNPTDRYVLEAYNHVISTGTPRLDHIATKLPRLRSGNAKPINYQRLLLPCEFPNGQPALVVLSVRTNKVDVNDERFDLMSSSMCMD